jgi:hypothetical protein
MPSADKSRVLRKRAKLYEVPLHACSVAFACDRFFRSRGMPTGIRENFNKWNPTEESKTDGLEIP